MLWDLFEDAQFRLKFRFLIVGLWNTFFAIFLYMLFLYVFGESRYVWALFASSILAIIHSFLLHKFVTWKSKSATRKEFPKFLALNVVLGSINLVSVPMIVTLLNIRPTFAQIMVLPFILMVSFKLNRIWVFKVE
jgi:putative flippase GtrA